LKGAGNKFVTRTGRTMLAFLFAVLAASLPVQARNQAPGPALREVTDETGRVVRLPAQVRRIVSLAPSLTETVYALGLQ
jgi:ABC-type Fe3+-hydroxamate transport system substrate-binding protein